MAPEGVPPQRPLHTVEEIRQAVDPEPWQRVVYRRSGRRAGGTKFVAVRDPSLFAF
jgi:type IV secretory pathway ATPase VirB11/archaellum biosynthesis ATPase